MTISVTGNLNNLEVTKTGNEVVISESTNTVIISSLGAQGIQGNSGQGVPVGGTAGQVLEKINGTNYNTQWVTPSPGVTDHTLLSNIGTNSHPQIDSHISSTSNPHSVTKTQVGLSNVVNADTTTTANITDSTNKRFVTDADLVDIGNLSGVNTGDQDLSGYQPLDTQLTSLAGLSYTSNTLKVIRVNAGENGFELITPSAGVTDHTLLTNIGTNSHTTIDSHIAASSAHGVTGDIVGTTGSQSLTNKTIDADLNTITNIKNADIKALAAIAGSKINPTIVTLTDAATITVNATLGNQFEVTLGASRTLGNPTGSYNGQILLFAIRQNGTGNFTLIADTKYRFNDVFSDFELNSTANKTTYIICRYHSTDDKFDVLDVRRMD